MSSPRRPGALSVHRATSEAERQAIYRFRYEIYFEEYGRLLGGPDHRLRQVTDADDLLETSTLLYTGTPEKITGTVRLRHWAAGDVPSHDIEELSIDRFDGYGAMNTAEIGRLMVRPSLRGKLILAALLRASYELLTSEHETDLTFCYCSPGLVRYYQHLAMRPFGGRPVHAPDGVMLPLVSVMTDVAYYRSTGSFLAPLAEQHAARSGRPAFDWQRYGVLFASDRCGLRWDAEDVLAETVRCLGQRGLDELGKERCEGEETGRLIEAMSRPEMRQLVAQGLIFEVPAGLMVTRRGFVEQELYVVLEGECEVWEDGATASAAANDDRASQYPVCKRRAGEIFGEDSLIDAMGMRQKTVVTTTAGRLLALPGKAIVRWLRTHPQITASQGRSSGYVPQREISTSHSTLQGARMMTA